MEKKQKNLKINIWDIFHPYANFSCPYLKIGLCDLLPVLLDCITYYICWEWFDTLTAYTRSYGGIYLYTSMDRNEVCKRVLLKVSPGGGGFESPTLSVCCMSHGWSVQNYCVSTVLCMCIYANLLYNDSVNPILPVGWLFSCVLWCSRWHGL